MPPGGERGAGSPPQLLAPRRATCTPPSEPPITPRIRVGEGTEGLGSGLRTAGAPPDPPPQGLGRVRGPAAPRPGLPRARAPRQGSLSFGGVNNSALPKRRAKEVRRQWRVIQLPR